MRALNVSAIPSVLVRTRAYLALLLVAGLSVALLSPSSAGPSGSGPEPPDGELNLVFVMDGLRPDSINEHDTPNLHRLREGGVNVTRGHAEVPTVTWVNLTALATGTHPGSNGIMANRLYVPELDPTGPIAISDPNRMFELEEKTGAITFTDPLAEVLAKNGKNLVTIGTGGGRGGANNILNTAARHGTGVMISAADPRFADVPFAFPEEVETEMIDRFGLPPTDREPPTYSNEVIDYATTVLTDYVLTDLDPDAVLFYMAQPDQVQHDEGAGAPDSVAAIRNNDRNLGLVLDRLRELGLEDKTNIFVISDHGFSDRVFGVNLVSELIDAGLKDAPDSEDVIVAPAGGSALIHVKDRSPRRIRDIATFLQRQDWTAALYTAACRPPHGQCSPAAGKVKEKGWVNGTFSLDLIHQANPVRGADILIAFPWDSEPNEFGIPGTQHYIVSSGETGPVEGPGGGHGSFSPHDITNTFIAWGADIKDGTTSHVPASTVDIAPTVTALLGGDPSSFDGRVLEETLNDGPDPADVRTNTQVFTTHARNAPLASAIQITTVGERRYVDKSWRLP